MKLWIFRFAFDFFFKIISIICLWIKSSEEFSIQISISLMSLIYFVYLAIYVRCVRTISSLVYTWLVSNRWGLTVCCQVWYRIAELNINWHTVSLCSWRKRLMRFESFFANFWSPVRWLIDPSECFKSIWLLVLWADRNKTFSISIETFEIILKNTYNVYGNYEWEC